MCDIYPLDNTRRRIMGIVVTDDEYSPSIVVKTYDDKPDDNADDDKCSVSRETVCQLMLMERTEPILPKYNKELQQSSSFINHRYKQVCRLIRIHHYFHFLPETVRECKDVSGIMYAIKTIDKSRAPRLDHIKREVELLRVVDHPNILKMIDSFEDEHYTYIVTEMYTGGDLFDLVVNNIKDHGCLPESQAMMITKALLKSVHYLHSKDIVHRDIKPENILVLDDVLKVADFGSCRGIYSPRS